MDKLNEFKSFIKNQDHVIDRIKSGELTWQYVYEMYDLYGPDYKLFKKEEVKEEKKKDSNNYINNALKAFQDVDMDKISENLQSLQKVLGIFSEFSKGGQSNNGPNHSMSRGRYKRYND